MKTFAAVAIVLTMLAMEGAAQAQTCWTDVKSWTGNYNLIGHAPSGPCTNDPQGTCTTHQLSSADVSTTFSEVVCGVVGWGGSDANLIVSFIDTKSDPCQPEGTRSVTVAGDTPVLSDSDLTFNVSNGTYSYSGSALGGGTETKIGCDGKKGKPQPIEWILNPVSNWPQTFPLPSSPQTLSPDEDHQSFQALSALGQTASWKIFFTLTPNYDPDGGCKQYGGQGIPESSSIGCETQSLGEDMPVVGTGFVLHYEGDRAPGAGADGIASADAAMIGGWTLSVHHAYDPATNTLFLGDGSQRNGYQLGTPVSFNGNLLLTSGDGSEVYVFASAGQHLQTLRPLTGALVYQFGYDAAGELVTVTDASGNVTTIQRNASEQPTAIVSPYGQTTTLAVDSNTFLSQVTDPLGKSATFVNSNTGLLTSRTDENGNVFSYTYDNNGRLAQDADPLGGYTALTRTNAGSGFGWTVGETTSMGRTSSYQSTLTMPWVQDGTPPFSEQRMITWPDGLQATSSNSLQNGQISKSFTLPDGTADSETLGPDPVWGLQVPVDTSETLTQGNLTMNITGSRSTTLGMAGNPFTVTTETDTTTINMRTYTSTFTGSNLTWVKTSPAGRTLTFGLDSLERVASTQVEGLTATDFSYDSQGRLASATQGTRKTTLGYNSEGFLASVTDPLKLTTSFAYDADGHLASVTLPDGRVINYDHDANGNLTSVTPPGESAHDFAYTAVDLPSSYTPPTVAGTGATTYTYDLDRDLTTITRPDGETIQLNYDNAGRLSSTVTPTETINYTYNSTTGNPSTAAVKSGEHLAYSYNGPLPTSSTWTGMVAGSVSRAYNDDFWVTTQTVKGGSKVAFTYDHDGLLTKAGALSLKRSAKNSLITGTTLGSATDTRAYDSFGEPSGYTASYGAAPLYSLKFIRDADGRITSKSETIGGSTNSFVYGYDLAGRLVKVTENGTNVDSYSYDSNSNRVKAVSPSGVVKATYDAQDRLLSYGNASYTYTANGELASPTEGGQSTSYQYDVLGKLIAVTLPNGTKITYVVDAENHRVGKELNGVLETGFLYDGHNLVAQLNGSNQLVSQFVYASGATSPDYMVRGGVTYRIFSDQVGSPRLVINTSTGTVAEQINYDEFGNVISDTNPGFQPFGFAGGLYDQDTKLVRFGARDYNPSIGRWTAKDPILFAGGDTNLYGYALNDAVNLIDPSGMNPFSGANPFLTMFYNYSTAINPAVINPAVVIPLVPPVVGPATESDRYNPGSISALRDVLPNYNARRFLGPQGCLNAAKDFGKIFTPPSNYPNSSNFNPGGPWNLQGATQGAGSPPETVEPPGGFEVDPVAP